MEKCVRLISSDREEICIPVDCVKRVTVLQDMLSDLGDRTLEVIPLSNLRSETLKTMVDLLERTRDDQNDQVEQCRDVLESLSHGQIKTLANALNFLCAEDLLVVVCMYMRGIISTMPQEQVNVFLRGS